MGTSEQSTGRGTRGSPQNNASEAFYARLRGRVQGVGFRYSATREADQLGIQGWVRNDINGDVEVWAEGSADQLEAFLRWLRRGAQFARVDSVEKTEQRPRGYQGFGVEY
ncbi:acylphosphatase [Spirochaetia bacterium]|nr:acylphosphatase [Spirochaetia bacterium]